MLFFDELPWSASPRSRFLLAFEHFWNSWASKQPHLMVVICGSAASWMLTKVIRSKGGLHNRVTRRIRLQPFTLTEVEEYAKSLNAKWSRKDLLELYMTLGGVPHYLKDLNPSQSIAQHIDALCFQPEGALRDEFANVFQALFDHAERHITIIEALASRPQGLTCQWVPSGQEGAHASRRANRSFLSWSPPMDARGTQAFTNSLPPSSPWTPSSENQA